MPRTAPLRPVIELATALPEVILRASSDQQGMVFAACVHRATDLPLSIVAHVWTGIRRAGDEAIQIGAAVFMLAPGEATRLLTWLSNAGSESTGEC